MTMFLQQPYRNYIKLLPAGLAVVLFSSGIRAGSHRRGYEPGRQDRRFRTDYWYSYQQAIRHYRVQRDVESRIDPVALTPRDFVDEWLTSTWRDGAAWSEDSSVAPLQQSHKELHSDSC